MPEYEQAMHTRHVWIEPLFAEAKSWHGLRRFRLRGLETVNSEALLVVSGQKLAGGNGLGTPLGASKSLHGPYQSPDHAWLGQPHPRLR
jgi:hypothetical protein